MRSSILSRCFLVVSLLALAGCPSNTASTTGNRANDKKPTTPAQASGPKSYALSDLQVGLADYLPLLDEGRIEIAGPKEWFAGSRQADQVAWYHRYKSPNTLPQIRIQAIDAPADTPRDVTPVNVEEFAKWLAGDVKKKLKNNEQLIEPVVPIVLGDNAFGRYVRKGSYNGADAEQHLLVTVRGGRLYTLQQLLLRGELESKTDVRDAAYAVAAGLKFHEASTPSEPSFDPPSETPAETPPVETPPVESPPVPPAETPPAPAP